MTLRKQKLTKTQIRKDARAAKAASGSSRPSTGGRNFHLEFKNEAQSLAWAAFQQHDVLFLVGPAGTGKSHLASAFAIEQVLNKEKKKIVLTRPIVESGESLGFLPGEFEEKVKPYMMPLFDCMDKMVGKDGPWRDQINQAVEVAPTAYMRGRSQPLDAKILTPDGYRSMGEIKEGDFVIGSDGTPTRVEKIYPQGKLDVFEITFTDGTSVECSADHLWDTTTINERRYRKAKSTKTTAEISESLKHGHAYNHQIPISRPVQFSEKNLEIDPYVLGALLGDGCLHQSASITLTSVDEQIVAEVQKRLPEGLHLVLVKDVLNKAPQYRIVNQNVRQNNELKGALRNLDILGTLSYNKSIPACYMQGSVAQRLELLRGLMDTDGCCFEQDGKRKPRVQFYSTSAKLAQDVASLVYSLGGTASVRHRKMTGKDSHELNGRSVCHNHDVYVVSIRMLENPFKLDRKADKFVPLKPIRAIINVEKVGRKECQCIRVDAKDSLYLTEHCIVTHNTFDDAICIFDEAQNASMLQLKLFLTRFGENSKIIITGDPNQSDLGGKVALVEVMHRLKDVNGIGIVEFKNNSIVRHPLIGTIIDRLGD
jgi:phosphate starvation-inducible protein PhoH and related proteins